MPARQPRVTELAHGWVAQVLLPGEPAIDATAGNGHDTLFLARAVGARGKVFAFDVQRDALVATGRRLDAAGARSRVELMHRCHSEIATALPPDAAGKVAAAMFNLGYLPGGDHARTTRTATTLQALGAALEVLRPGGLLTVICYPGHPEGSIEAEAVDGWAAALQRERFEVARFPSARGERGPAPFLITARLVAR